MMTKIILRLPKVKERTGLSRSTIYALIKGGQFKAPISLGARAVGWLESDVSDFIEARIKASRKA
ncbi:helix-turn-helix transcriptional regulator [Undibacterium arcticum]|uniref:Helix-turn-helix transcriptional regulator n=2 Tax=Undibacterium arcticum TaxID=1762892 RepID=A0ABV7EY93_9BURK